jgi:hypothetical protein
MSRTGLQSQLSFNFPNGVRSSLPSCERPSGIGALVRGSGVVAVNVALTGDGGVIMAKEKGDCFFGR